MTTVEERIRAAFELRELTIAIRREALKREDPEASEEEIDARLPEWVLTPPDPFGPFRERTDEDS